MHLYNTTKSLSEFPCRRGFDVVLLVTSSPVQYLFLRAWFPSVPEEWHFSASSKRKAERFENILTYSKLLHIKSVMISK